MFRLTLSNRFELLLENLLDRLANETGSPFTAQQVIVPSTAVRRRVELACADRQGICANVEFSYLAQWLWTQIGHLVEIREQSPFAPVLLAWRVFELLGDAGFTSDGIRVSPATSRGADPVMRLDLAQRCAQLIEHYITYRPQWLAAWSEGRKRADMADSGWPSRRRRRRSAGKRDLWRRLTAELGIRRQHPAVAFFEKIEGFGSDAPRRAGLPASASIFCLPTLPPLYLDILRQLSRWIDIQALCRQSLPPSTGSRSSTASA
jgi:exodeoxyribonuclease V gamma subunit